MEMMKKFFLIPLSVLAMAVSATTCSNIDNKTEKQVALTGDEKILIAYFSYPEPDGVNASSGASSLIKNDVLLGNTEYLAQIIQEATDGDTFRIQTVQQYPASHEPLIAQASEEKEAGARPALATRIENLNRYDIIFIGYPNWWGDLPMPLYTFLEEYDFSGKIIIPFNSHGGSGLSNTVNTITGLEPGATVVKGFTVSRNTVGEAKNDVLDWLKETGIIK
jgi:flavodoxin